MSIEQGRDISELFRRVNNLLRVGVVVAVDYGTARAQVKIGKNTTDFIPWLTPSTNVWIPLAVGEQVLVLSPNGDLRMAMILPALYQNAKPAPSSDTNLIRIVSDVEQTGNKIITGTLQTTDSITTDAKITATGDITTDGKMTASGEVEGNGIKLSTHTHDFQYVGMGQGATPQSATTKKPS
jgi:phage baseplate assembly protein gpV